MYSWYDSLKSFDEISMTKKKFSTTSKQQVFNVWNVQ